VAALGDVSQVVSELLFFDNEKVIFIRLNQPQIEPGLASTLENDPPGNLRVMIDSRQNATRQSIITV
jgi:hypothetical protein